MLASDSVQKNFPALKLTDSVSDALGLMKLYGVSHLPITERDKLIGVVSQEDLDGFPESEDIGNLRRYFSDFSVSENEHIFHIIKLFDNTNISLLPVVNENGILVGNIAQNKILHLIAGYLGHENLHAILVVEKKIDKFNLTDLSRIIDQNKLHIILLHLQEENALGLMVVTIVSKKYDISDVLTLLERYDFTIRYYHGGYDQINGLRNNYENLMSYLKL